MGWGAGSRKEAKENRWVCDWRIAIKDELKIKREHLHGKKITPEAAAAASNEGYSQNWGDRWLYSWPTTGGPVARIHASPSHLP